MVLIFRLIRFILPLVLMYLIFQVLRNFLYYFGATGYSGRGSSYSESRSNTKNERRHAFHKRRDPYSVLGCSADASDEEIKSCYRKMVGRYHPDRFIGQELDQEFVDLATERFKEIQDAYDQIRKMRGIA